MASFSFPSLGKEKIKWTARPLGDAQMKIIIILLLVVSVVVATY